MNWYVFVFVWVGIMAVVYNTANCNVTEIVNGEKVQRYKFTLAFVAFFPVFYLAVFTHIRFDGYLYMSTYKALPTTIEGLRERIDKQDSGKAFTILGYIVKNATNTNETIYRMVLGLIHTIPVVLIFRKYSENYLVTLYLFLATGCHLAWMMNGMRQFIAVVIIFAATPLLLEKKYIPLIIVILFASTFHSSALIMLPLIFVVQGEVWNKKTILYMIIAIAAMMYFNNNAGALDSVLEGTEYANLEKNYKLLGDDGVHPLRVLVSAVPPIIAFIGRKKIVDDNNKVANIFINMSIVTFGINLVAMVTSGIMIGRLPIYTLLYSLVVLPYLINKVFEKETAKLVNIAMVALYGLYYVILS